MPAYGVADGLLEDGVEGVVSRASPSTDASIQTRCCGGLTMWYCMLWCVKYPSDGGQSPDK